MLPLIFASSPMKLSTEGARWFVHLRWVACAIVFSTVTVGWLLDVIPDPVPLWWVGAVMLICNSAFWLYQRRLTSTQENVDRHIAMQILCDVSALTLLLYFADLARNPFLYFFTLPMIIAGMYLRGRTPYYFGAFVTVLVGGIMGLEYHSLIPRFPVRFAGESPPPLVAGYLIATFVAFASTLWITLYFAKSIRAYVDRAHEELRQKEKMVGIGQLVAGIGHQIANPLDGVQNCLRRIGERVRDDARLTEYVQLMEEALDRIEKTTKRVQSFARPRGIELEATSVNAAVEATLQLLGPQHKEGIAIETALGDVPLVRGDAYTLQEVLFNLCMNAIAAMPQGGELKLRTLTLGPRDDLNPGDVAIEVTDTGVGIPRGNLERIFEPFFTTRADSGGTGLGLGLCRMLISEMDGRIQVRSALNQGTTFTVVLPRAEHAAKEAAKE
jgi:signal transduction histidine kinase